MHNVVKYMLIAMYAVTLGTTMRYYLNLLQEHNWDQREYFHTLFRENLRWLPLIFMVVPAAALTMGYRTLGKGMMFLYLLAITLWFGFGKKRNAEREDAKKRQGLFLLWGILWVLLVLVCLALPKSKIHIMNLICSVAFFMQPFGAPLLAAISRPAEHSIGRKYIRKSGDLLKRRKGLQIIVISGTSDQEEMARLLEVLLAGKFRCKVTTGMIHTALEAARAIRSLDDPRLEILICPMEADSKEELEAIAETLHPEIVIRTSMDYGTLLEETDPFGEYGIRLINGDDEVLLAGTGRKNTRTYGLCANCDIRGSILSVGSEGTRFSVSDSGQRETEFLTILLGERRIRLLTGDVFAARALGMSDREIRYRIASILPMLHHMQLVAIPNAMLIDDSANTDPDRAEEALRTLEHFEGEKVLLTSGFTCLGAIQEACNHRIGELAAEICSRIILMGEEVPYGIRTGILDAGFRPEMLYEAKDQKEAAAWIGSWPQEEQRVLLAERLEMVSPEASEANGHSGR